MHRSAVTSLVESDERVQRTYQFHRKISNGCFGYLFLVTNRYTNRRSALKVEVIKNESSLTLKKEMHLLKKLEGVKGVPQVFNFGRTEKLLYLELELLETDLSYLTEKDSKVDYAFIVKIGGELLRVLQEVHSRSIVHRDIKPQNIMLDKEGRVYLIDFGISKEFIAGQSGISKTSFVGTPRYASINAHKGRNQVPADDIESLLYNLIFMCRKDLPWINTKTVGNNKLDAILAMKLKKPRLELCKDLPKCFLLTFEHIHNLKPEEKPHYEYLIGLFRDYNTTTKTQLKSEPASETSTPIIVQATHMQKVLSTARRPSIECSNFLLVPLPDNVVTNSQATIDFQESQQVMRSESSMSNNREPPSRIRQEDMQESLSHEDSVEQRMQALSKLPLNGRFRTSLLRH